MTEQGWRAMVTVIQEAQAGFDQELTARLATGVQELDVPPSVLERVQQAATTAVGRAFQRDSTRSACVTVLTQVMRSKDARMSRSWGFFVVEHGAGEGEQQRIEVFLYPDGS